MFAYVNMITIMTTEALSTIKLGQEWEPFIGQHPEENPDGKISSPPSTLEGYGQIRAELIPLDTDKRFYALPLKELRGRKKLSLEDRSRLYMVRILLTTRVKLLEWEDEGEGISTLYFTLPPTDQGQPTAKGTLNQFLDDGRDNIEVTFNDWAIDTTLPVFDWLDKKAYGFNLTTTVDNVQNLKFTFGESEHSL